MLHKLALLVASLAAALVLAGGLALAGFGPTQRVTDAVQQVDQVAAPADAATEAPVQVDTVYLTAQEKPKHITVTKVKPAPRNGGEREHENERGGDD
jgi:hypothetical protein